MGIPSYLAYLTVGYIVVAEYIVAVMIDCIVVWVARIAVGVAAEYIVWVADRLAAVVASTALGMVGWF